MLSFLCDIFWTKIFRRKEMQGGRRAALGKIECLFYTLT